MLYEVPAAPWKRLVADYRLDGLELLVDGEEHDDGGQELTNTGTSS